jgi:hypothetical protein
LRGDVRVAFVLAARRAGLPADFAALRVAFLELARFAVVFRVVVFRAVVFRAVAFRAVDFRGLAFRLAVARLVFFAAVRLLALLRVVFRAAGAALLVSPASRRCLLTVRAAISSARSSLVPRCSTESLMCSYCRVRFALFTPRGGMPVPP